MKKIILFVIIAIVVIGGGMGILLQAEQSAVLGQVEQLSQRSQEYLKDRPSNKETSLKYAAISEDGKSVDQANQTFTVGNCFRFTLPFRVTSSREERDCFISIALRTPRGSIVAYKKTEPAKTLSDVSGIPMRRLYTDIYSEKLENVNGREFLIFSKKDQFFEKNAFTLLPDGYLVVNVTLYGGDNPDKSLLQLLQSIEIIE